MGKFKVDCMSKRQVGWASFGHIGCILLVVWAEPKSGKSSTVIRTKLPPGGRAGKLVLHLWNGQNSKNRLWWGNKSPQWSRDPSWAFWGQRGQFSESGCPQVIWHILIGSGQRVGWQMLFTDWLRWPRMECKLHFDPGQILAWLRSPSWKFHK